MAVVDLPTPPFWFAIAIILPNYTLLFSSVWKSFLMCFLVMIYAFIIALIVEYFHKNVSRETFFYWYFIGYIVYGEIE